MFILLWYIIKSMRKHQWPRLCTCNGVVYIAPGFAIVVFSSLDDHQVSREVNPPGKSTGGNQNLRKTRAYQNEITIAVNLNYTGN